MNPAPPSSAPVTTPSETRASFYLQGSLIAFISLLLLSRCWDAEFINYDDIVHIHLIPEVYGKGSFLGLFKQPTDTYMPLTFVSYRIDYVLFGKWMLEHWHNWAPAVRLMTWFYHACASLILWRLLLSLRIGRLPALFIALVFAIHPTACETVCWASERKNALAAMFGLASLWSFLALDGRKLRVPVAFLLYTAAICSKPTALGFLPLFGFVELFNGAAGLRGERPMRWVPDRSWLWITARMIPFTAISMLVLYFNIRGKTDTIVPPPGGSVYTGILTDAEVLIRYIGIMLAPAQLSIAYYVEPIVSLIDPRLIGYGAILAATVALTVYLARNRRMAIFGWIWFVVVLTPCLNIVCISYAMQDRYIYFTLPGFFLALSEALIGLRARVAAISPGVLRIGAAAFVAMLAILSIARGALYSDVIFLAEDAAVKQPQSAFAHYLLINSYSVALQGFDGMPHLDANMIAERNKTAQKEQEERRIFLMSCPDAERQVAYTTVAINYGEFLFRQGFRDESTRGANWDEAERLFKIAAFPGKHIVNSPRSRASALRDLAMLRLAQGGRAQEAYDFTQQALNLADAADISRLLRGKAGLALSEGESKAGHAEKATQLKEQAREDFKSIPADSDVAKQAKQLLDEMSAAP